MKYCYPPPPFVHLVLPRYRIVLLMSWCLSLGMGTEVKGAPPSVSNLTAAQRPGSEMVEIRYDLADQSSPVLAIRLDISNDGGVTWTVPAAPATGDLGPQVTRGTGRLVLWNAGIAWDNRLSMLRFRITASDIIDTGPPADFALIPAGAFQMGNFFPANDEKASPWERPVHQVTLDAFYMGKYEVSWKEWYETYNWAVSYGYRFAGSAAWSASASDLPAGRVDWMDVLKWCNAKTERESNGLVPCYTFKGSVLRTGDLVDPPDGQWKVSELPQCDFTKNGYRLPTEAEWEKAARGGLSGKRFPWGDSISYARANYFSPFVPESGMFYDESRGSGTYHPVFGPNLAPVRTFTESANGYGLLNMAGNVGEWCWDIFSMNYYTVSPVSNPHGPDLPSSQFGHGRCARGGNIATNGGAHICRVAARGGGSAQAEQIGRSELGFRLARKR